MPAEVTTEEQRPRTAEPDAGEPEREEAKAEEPKREEPKGQEPKGEEAKASPEDKADPEEGSGAEAKAAETQEKKASEGREKKAAENAETKASEDAEKKASEGAEGDADEGRASSSRSRRLSWAALAKAAVLVALAASVVTAGLQWYRADQAAQREAERRAVRARASEFGQALLSYDHRNLQAARNRVLSMASDDFAKTYDAAFTGGLESVITRLKADATATVRTVYLGDIEGSTARAIVVMDSEVHSSAGTRRVLGSYLDMRLTRTGKRWRVTEVTSIGAADETMTGDDGEQKQGGDTPLPTPSASSSGR
ncbi:hypothetical protein Acsp04_45950 [Actinomadura sp. NBRC 104425]|uniref:hypothetical protein n=1 Tax=Actinomadura sp. NBRC 104425 TaxID=3032204 RepID=UPI0024A01151|nr:hypothetical protein [Actinomadura sp. NBRC 104425]GLZ14360.1 hypothetical protein Acsp04_45950 [Actinomadura sp. NBRC 104425]